MKDVDALLKENNHLTLEVTNLKAKLALAEDCIREIAPRCCVRDCDEIGTNLGGDLDGYFCDAHKDSDDAFPGTSPFQLGLRAKAALDRLKGEGDGPEED